MFEAARTGDSTLLLSAVDSGLPVNLTNDKGVSHIPKISIVSFIVWPGNTLLMLAAYAGHTELTKGLLDRGADPNRINDLGQSIIAGAVFKSHNDIVHALMDKGADPRLGTPNAVQAAYMFERNDLMAVLGAQESDFKGVPPPISAATPDLQVSRDSFES